MPSSPSTDPPSSLSSLSSLAVELEQLSQGSLPSLPQLYRIGDCLYQWDTRKQQNQQRNTGGGFKEDDELFMAYQELIDSLPEAYLQQVFQGFYKAISSIVLLVKQEASSFSTASSRNESSSSLLLEACQSISGLWSHSPKLCAMVATSATAWVSLLAKAYDTIVLWNKKQKQQQDALFYSAQKALLSSLSFLFLDGILGGTPSNKSSGNSREETLLHAIRAIEENSSDMMPELLQWQNQSEPYHRTLPKLIEKLPMPNAADDADDLLQQREYILSMLDSAQQDVTSSSAATSSAVADDRPTTSKIQPSNTRAKPVSAAEELERRIQQVKQILPDFGEGFIETALSLYGGNVETTVSTLLQEMSHYPTALQVLDKSLPRRRKERSEDEIKASAEARNLVKERVALEEEREQARYKALLYVQRQEKLEAAQNMMSNRDEYDDDYDDQYDDLDAQLGNADDGNYDFEQVKLYNQLLRGDVAEESFWEETRNTNRAPKQQQQQKKQAIEGNEGDDEENERGGKQYRGPDKIRGGRIIGPDGKVQHKPKRNRNNAKGGQDNQNQQQPGAKPKPGANNTGGSNPQQNNSNNNIITAKKPKTKPKAGNRINRQRDKKARNQGTFGVQD